MYLTEQLEQKWSPVLDHEGLSSIKDAYRRAVTAVILENQEKAMAEESRTLNEAAPTNSTGGGFNSGATATGPVAGFDPIATCGLGRRDYAGPFAVSHFRHITLETIQRVA